MEAVTDDEARALLRAAVALLERWGLRTEEKRVLLGGPSKRTYQRWLSDEVGPLPNDTILRLGELFLIHKALRTTFTDAERAYEWVKRPNDAFGGRSALDVMLQGGLSDIRCVRAYLVAERLA